MIFQPNILGILPSAVPQHLAHLLRLPAASLTPQQRQDRERLMHRLRLQARVVRTGEVQA